MKSPEDDAAAATQKTDAALAAEKRRTNVPFSSRAWDNVASLSPADRDQLAWFHLHALDRGLTNTEVGSIIGYDRTSAYRILNGTYGAQDWSPIVAAVRAYRARIIESTSVPGIDKEPSFIPTTAARMFTQGLDYASRGGMVLLAGPSGAGKTKSVIDWDLRHPGRMIRFNAPVTGAHVALIRDLAHRIGIGVLQKNSTATVMRGIVGKLGPHQVIVVDQGSRLLPSTREIRASSLEVLMEINERCGCGIVIPLTWRSIETMKDMIYQIEQITGRAEIFRAPTPTLDDIIGIADQYGSFAPRTLNALLQLALKPGGLRTVAKVLSLADRMARADKSQADPSDEHVAAAISRRFQNMGGRDPFDQD